MNDKQFDTEALRSGSQQTDRTAQDAGSAWERLRNKSDGMGDIFGDDMVGGVLGAAYAAVYQLTEESFGSATEDLQDFADGLQVTAQNNDDTEQAGSDASRGLEQGLDGGSV